MDDSQRSSNNCSFQHWTEKDFVTGLIRDFSRKLVKESNVWKNPPKDWPEKELGPWKCPTANGKDNLDLMKKKLKYLRTRVPDNELSSAEIQKLQCYDKGDMKSINEFIHSENSLDALKKVKNFLVSIKGKVPDIHENLTQMKMLLDDLIPLLAEACVKDRNSVSDRATVTNSRKRSCPTSAAPKVTPAKQRKPEPVPIAPKPSPAANPGSLIQSTTTSHIPSLQPYDSLRSAGLSDHDNFSKSTTSNTSPVPLQGPLIILISHNQDVAHPDVSTEHANPVIDSVTDTSSCLPPVSSPQHPSPSLPTQSPESSHENNKTGPDSMTPITLTGPFPAMAQLINESSIQDDTYKQTSSCSADSVFLSVGTPSSSSGNVGARSCSVDSGFISEEIHSADTDEGDIQLNADNLKDLDGALSNFLGDDKNLEDDDNLGIDDNFLSYFSDDQP